MFCLWYNTKWHGSAGKWLHIYLLFDCTVVNADCQFPLYQEQWYCFTAWMINTINKETVFNTLCLWSKLLFYKELDWNLIWILMNFSRIVDKIFHSFIFQLFYHWFCKIWHTSKQTLQLINWQEVLFWSFWVLHMIKLVSKPYCSAIQ